MIENDREGYPDTYGLEWHVTDPSTGLEQTVQADAPSTARDEAEYDARVVLPAREDEGDARCMQADVDAIGEAPDREP